MVAPNESLASVVARVNAFLASVHEQAKDGLTWVEFGRILTQLLYLAVDGLEAVTTMSGAEKKDIVLTAAAALFDSFADVCVPPVAWPVWLVIRPAIRLLVLSLASGAIEAILKVVRAP